MVVVALDNFAAMKKERNERALAICRMLARYVYSKLMLMMTLEWALDRAAVLCKAWLGIMSLSSGD